MLMGLSLLSQPAQALDWNFSYTLNDGGVYTGTYVTDGSSPATDTIYNVTGISGTIAKGGTTVLISGLGNAIGNNTFKWDGTGIGVSGFGIEFNDTNGGQYNLTGMDPNDPSYVFTGLGIFSSPLAISNGDIVTNNLAPATAVPWETDALPVIGSTVLFGAGLWAKRKFAKPLQK